MLSIFKKSIPSPPDLSGIVTDMHSHLIPGIDDGSPDADTSLHLIRGLTALGYKKFIATPHVLWDIYKNTHGTISPAHQQLTQALSGNNLDIPVRFAAEYFLDDHVTEQLESETPLLTITKNWVLTEFSFISAPLDLKEKLFALQIAGYQPVLAHPERYLYFARDKGMYDTLKEAGYYFQVNLLSLAGYYGRGAQELGEYLVKKNYVDLLGTDLHHVRHLQALQTSPKLTDFIKEVQDSGKFLNPGL